MKPIRNNNRTARIILLVAVLVIFLIFLMQIGTSSPVSVHEDDDENNNNNKNNNQHQQRKGQSTNLEGALSSSKTKADRILFLKKNKLNRLAKTNLVARQSLQQQNGIDDYSSLDIDGCSNNKKNNNNKNDKRTWPSFLSYVSRKHCPFVLEAIESQPSIDTERILRKQSQKHLQISSQQQTSSKKVDTNSKLLKDRRPSAPFITGDGFRATAKFIFDETTVPTWDATSMKTELLKWANNERHPDDDDNSNLEDDRAAAAAAKVQQQQNQQQRRNRRENTNKRKTIHDIMNEERKKQKIEDWIKNPEKYRYINSGTDLSNHCQDLRWDRTQKKIVFDHGDVVPQRDHHHHGPGYRAAPTTNSRDSKAAYWKDATKRMIDLSEDSYLQDHSRIMDFLRFDCLNYGDPIFVQTHLLDKFINEVLPIIQKRYDVFLDICERGGGDVYADVDDNDAEKVKKQLGRSEEATLPLSSSSKNSNKKNTLAGCGEKLKSRMYQHHFPAFVLITHNSDYSSPFDSSNTRGIKTDPEDAKFEKQIEKLLLSPLLLRWFGQNLVLSPERQRKILTRFNEMHPTTAYPFHIIEEAKRLEKELNAGKINFAPELLFDNNPKNAMILNEHLKKNEKERREKGLIRAEDEEHLKANYNSAGHLAKLKRELRERKERQWALDHNEPYPPPPSRRKSEDKIGHIGGEDHHDKGNDDDNDDHEGDDKNKSSATLMKTHKPRPQSEVDILRGKRSASVLKEVSEHPKRDLNDKDASWATDHFMLVKKSNNDDKNSFFVSVKFLKAKMIPIPIGIENRYNRYGRFVASNYALTAGCFNDDDDENDHFFEDKNVDDKDVKNKKTSVSSINTNSIIKEDFTINRENFDHPLVAFSVKTNKREREDAISAIEENFSSSPSSTAADQCVDHFKKHFDRIMKLPTTHPLRFRFPFIFDSFSSFSLQNNNNNNKNKKSSKKDSPATLQKNRETLLNYLAKLKCYGFTMSPHGHGVDTHRVWEALYSGSIPITSVSAMDDQLMSQLPVFIAKDHNNNRNNHNNNPSLLTSYNDYDYYSSYLLGQQDQQQSSPHRHHYYYQKGSFKKLVTKENLKSFWCKTIKGIVEPTLLINEIDARTHSSSVSSASSSMVNKISLLETSKASYKRSFDLFFKYSMNLPVQQQKQQQEQQEKLSISEMINLEKTTHEKEEAEWRRKIITQHNNDDENNQNSNEENHDSHHHINSDELALKRKLKYEVNKIPKHVKFNFDLLDMSFWAMVVTMQEDPLIEVMDFL